MARYFKINDFEWRTNQVYKSDFSANTAASNLMEKISNIISYSDFYTGITDSGADYWEVKFYFISDADEAEFILRESL